jgi:uncharacterized protein (TIGR00251 family)
VARADAASATPPLDAHLTARLVLHIVPRAAATAVAGRHGDAIKVRIAAPPVEGAANEELIRFLAAQLGVPRGAITIIAGEASRRKTISIAGIGTATAIKALGL